MVAFNTAPPYWSQYGLRSVPPPARPSRSGARARTTFSALFMTVLPRQLGEGGEYQVTRAEVAEFVRPVGVRAGIAETGGA